jgi:adenylate cyclase
MSSAPPPSDLSVTEVWRTFLTTGVIQAGPSKFVNFAQSQHLFRWLPHDPRCRLCYSPFEGLGGWLSRVLFDRTRSRLNPQMCNACEQFAKAFKGGAEVEMSVLFADVRGSTGLAEGMSPSEFSRLIGRFYTAATDILFHADALVEKFVGDAVTGLFVPGLAGPAHPRRAVEAAEALLRVTGHADPAGPWISVGVGVHTGTAFLGAVGDPNDVVEISALGDAVNVCARLSALAGPGEVLLSSTTGSAAGLDPASLETRRLQLKGRQEAVDAWVIRVGRDG